MIRKQFDDQYYTLQNGRSGMDLNSNDITKYLDKFKFESEPPLNFLDVGCRGHCSAVKFFADRGFNSYGFDIGENAKAIWDKRRIKNVVLHDAHKPFPFDVKFHLISMSHVLEHCHDIDKVISNVWDALYYHGYVFCIVPVEVETTNQSSHYCSFQTAAEHNYQWLTHGFTMVESWESGGNSYVVAKKENRNLF